MWKWLKKSSRAAIPTGLNFLPEIGIRARIKNIQAFLL